MCPSHRLRRFALALVVTLAVAAAGTPLHAQATGTTDVDIDFPPLLILYYYSELDITLSSSAIADLLTDSAVNPGTAANGVDHYDVDEGTEAVTASLSGTALETTLTTPGAAAAGLDLTAVELNILEAWAVRALASASSSQYEIEVQRGDGTAAPANITLANGASQILITDTGIRNSGGGGFTAEATAITNTVPGLATPDTGDVQLILDLSNLTVGDLHTSASGTDYTITATHL